MGTISVIPDLHLRYCMYITGITATAGIGTNLYLAKMAIDIVAKKRQGVINE